jgi:hypothetical protein
VVSVLRIPLIVLLLLVAGAACGATPALAADFTVDTSADAGAGSLRQAIVDANTAPGPDAIKFAIPGAGVQTIRVTSDVLPDITGPVTIDGYSQPSATPNTLSRAGGTDTKLLIEVSGPSSGLKLKANDSTVKGLVINCVDNSLCPKAGLSIEGSNNVVSGNFIGTNSSGTGMAPNSTSGRFQDGVLILTGANNRVGGTAPADRNLLSGNSDAGVAVNAGNASQTAGGTVIRGNYIGTDAAGTAPLSTINDQGVQIRAGFGGVVSDTSVGGDTAGAGNLIAGNQYGEVEVQGAVGGTVYGNLIGTKRDGVQAISATSAESGGAVEIANARSFIIGGPTAARANTIAFKASGIDVDSANGIPDGPGDRNTISGNSIHDNTDLGIDLGRNSGVDQNDTLDADTGPNEQQNYPVLATAPVSGGSATVAGTLSSRADTTYRVEFFANSACDTTPSSLPSLRGFGEGETYLGAANVTTNASGVATFSGLSFPVPAGQSIITATATDPQGNTSEFSKCLLPPTANADTYATAYNTALTVPDGATDVLANDTDPDGDTLTAVKVSNPAHGSVTVNANGSFTYTPTTGYSGADSFTYKANDGTYDSNPAATVTVNVAADPGADPPPELTGPPNQTAVKAVSKSFALGSFQDSGTGSPWAVQVDWGDGTAVDTFQGSPGEALSRSHAYAQPGTYTVTETVTEAGPDPASDTATFTVTVTAPVVEPGTGPGPAKPGGSGGPAGTNSSGLPPSPGETICDRRQITLVRADVKGSKVRLSGLVGAALYGKAVTIRSNLRGAGGRPVTVQASKTGSFAASVPRPPRKSLITARYRAVAGGSKSKELKLPQSLTSKSVKSAQGTITVEGRVKRSLLGKRNKVAIRRLVCGRYRTVGSARPDATGRYKITFPATQILEVAFYRAESKVLRKPGSKVYVAQYGRAIAIRTTSQSG